VVAAHRGDGRSVQHPAQVRAAARDPALTTQPLKHLWWVARMMRQA